jgi:hypothetical protein
MPRKASRQVDQTDRVNAIKRMLAMRGEPIKMLRTVVNGMKPPEKTDAVLHPMAPIDEKVAQNDHFNRLQPEGLRRDPAAKSVRHHLIHPPSEMNEHPCNRAGPKEILAQKKAEIREPGGAKQSLPAPGGKNHFERAKDQNEE